MFICLSEPTRGIGLLPVVLAVNGGAVVVRAGLRRVAPPALRTTLDRAAPTRLGHRLAGRWGRPGKVAGATVLVLSLAWAPVAFEQVTRHPGNLTLLARDARRPSQNLPAAERTRVGPRHALSLFTRQFGVPAPWMGAHERRQYLDLDNIAGTGRPIDLVPLAALGSLALGVAIRRRDWPSLALVATAGAGAVGSFFPARQHAG